MRRVASLRPGRAWLKSEGSETLKLAENFPPDGFVPHKRSTPERFHVVYHRNPSLSQTQGFFFFCLMGVAYFVAWEPYTLTAFAAAQP